MTKDEKYEIAVLTSAVEQKRRVWEAHAMQNTPTHLIKREKMIIALTNAMMEWWEATNALGRARARIANKS